jgi:hypothetical protein
MYVDKEASGGFRVAALGSTVVGPDVGIRSVDATGRDRLGSVNGLPEAERDVSSEPLTGSGGPGRGWWVAGRARVS